MKKIILMALLIGAFLVPTLSHAVNAAPGINDRLCSHRYVLAVKIEIPCSKLQGSPFS